MELTNITRFSDQRNLGGNYKRFLFIPAKHVVAIPFYENDNLETEIILATGKNWLAAEAVFQTLRFTEKPIGDPGNPTGYDLIIEGEFAKNRLSLLRNIHPMEGQRFFLLVTDHNGYTRLAGNQEKDKNGVYKGIKFVAPFDSGEVVTNRNSYAFRFAGQQPVRAPFYFYDAEAEESLYVESGYVDPDYVE